MWRIEKTDEGRDFVWEGVETGIAPSPLKGTANIQNANISTELGEVMASFARTAQQHSAISGGTLTPDDATLFTAPAALKAGMWIKVTASTVSSITAATNPSSVSIDYLLVAGGGAGGPANTTNSAGGGGGAGEVVATSANFSVGSYAVTIGAGGTASSTIGLASDGNESNIAGIDTATGGGSGGRGATTTTDGRNGGSGGGGGGVQSTPTIGNGGTGSAGNDGGVGSDSGIGGGGGGAGADGAAAGANGGNGGVGITSSISGTSTYYGGGGGGGYDSGAGSAGTGGNGGGGAGGKTATGTAGTANTGGGGGGAGTTGATILGGDGGSGIAIFSYTSGSVLATGGTVTKVGTKTIHTFTTDGVFEVVWINPGGLYFVSFENTNGKIKLSDFFDPYSTTPLTHGTTGSITFDTVAVPNQMLAKAVENYNSATDTEYRYYLLDANGYVWCYDTQVYAYSLATFGVGTTWMLVDPADYSDLGPQGMAILNGNLMLVGTSRIFFKPTVDLGSVIIPMDNGYTTNPFPTHRKYAISGIQGKMYYTDNQFIGEVFPTTSLETSQANIQSYCKYTASSTTGTITELINGSVPYIGTTYRVPAVFFTDSEGTLPTALSLGTVYYIEYDQTTETFGVYDNVNVGSGSIINIATGASGNQYFNTFFPIGEAGPNGSNPLVQFTPQRVNLPFFEQATCLVGLGNSVIIGCEGAIVYPWNLIDATPSDGINLPEAGVQTMINVNNMAYIFAGNKGNIYISNGSVASPALKIPDYVAGVPGTPYSYIEPYFVWGDAMFLRGRVYFSILDQTATKAGNCGGVWSFVPSNNYTSGIDIGLSLRLENQNSYGDYDGYANILIPAYNQEVNAPQYWAAWQDSYNTATANFGIDFSTSNPVTTYIVETDLLPTGTLLSKDTFTQLEYKLANNLASGDSVQLYYRKNITDAWGSCGTVRLETTEPLSGYFDMAFQKTQWLQFRAVVTTNGTTTSSFVRLVQIRLR